MSRTILTMTEVLDRTEKDMKDNKFNMLSEEDLKNLEWAVKFLKDYERKHK